MSFFLKNIRKSVFPGVSKISKIDQNFTCKKSKLELFLFVFDISKFCLPMIIWTFFRLKMIFLDTKNVICPMPSAPEDLPIDTTICSLMVLYRKVRVWFCLSVYTWGRIVVPPQYLFSYRWSTDALQSLEILTNPKCNPINIALTLEPSITF